VKTSGIKVAFGSKRIVAVREIIGSRIRMGSYSITFDRDGAEIDRTPVTWDCELECWSEKEAKRLALPQSAGQEGK
jgi:hypothetical protein